MKTLTLIFLLLAAPSSHADEMTQPPADVRTTMEQYWQGVKAGKVPTLWIEKSAKARSKEDIKHFKESIGKKEFKIQYADYRAFEKNKTPHAMINVELQSPTGEPLYSSGGCYYLKKVRGRFKVTDFLGDCQN